MVLHFTNTTRGTAANRTRDQPQSANANNTRLQQINPTITAPLSEEQAPIVTVEEEEQDSEQEENSATTLGQEDEEQ